MKCAFYSPSELNPACDIYIPLYNTADCGGTLQVASYLLMETLRIYNKPLNYQQLRAMGFLIFWPSKTIEWLYCIIISRICIERNKTKINIRIYTSSLVTIIIILHKYRYGSEVGQGVALAGEVATIRVEDAGVTCNWDAEMVIIHSQYARAKHRTLNIAPFKKQCFYVCW